MSARYLFLIILSLTISISCKKILKIEPEESIKLPVLSLPIVDNITRETAEITASVDKDWNQIVSLKGICYSTSPNPTVSDFKLEKGAGTAVFTATLLKLKLNTTYYAKAFATNKGGTAYSEQIAFNTLPLSVPKIKSTKLAPTTTLFSTITSAKIIDDGGGPVSQKGFCWSKIDTPTVTDNKSITTTDSLSLLLNNLTPNTTYYIAPYATNSLGTGYGETIQIVVDVDGNVYNTVKIGTQVWMVENLKTTKLKDGTPLKNVTENCEWGCITVAPAGTPSRIKPPAYCWYDNDIKHKNIYGAIYNGIAANTGLLAPEGWHVPSNTEFGKLVTFLDPNTIDKIEIPPSSWGPPYRSYTSHTAVQKMLVPGNTYWYDPKFPKDNVSTNSSGFSAVGAGQRGNIGGDFTELNFWTCFWTSTIYEAGDHIDPSYTKYYNRNIEVMLTFGINGAIFNLIDVETNGWSVRCIKD